MLMPKKNYIAIYELLFKKDVMVAKKDVHMLKHPELVDKNMTNLHVMKAMQSLKTHGYVKEHFVWRHFYWYLTNEASSTYEIISGYPLQLCLPLCITAILKQADPGTKVWKVKVLLVLHEEKLIGIPTEEVQLLLMQSKMQKLVLGQLLNFSLEVDMDVGMVSPLSRKLLFICV